MLTSSEVSPRKTGERKQASEQYVISDSICVEQNATFLRTHTHASVWPEACKDLIQAHEGGARSRKSSGIGCGRLLWLEYLSFNQENVFYLNHPSFIFF